jgi:cobalt-zinc-cadmium efflux system membrane fusion protein
MKTASYMMTLFTLLLFACTKTTVDEHGHDHPHEEAGLEALAYTVYSDKTEIFVEFKPLVVGTKSKFAAHFTILGDNFLAMTEGKITVSLIVGETGIRNTAESPSSPGIFRLALSPTKAGKGKLVFDIVGKDYSDKIVIDDVIIYPNEQAAIDDQATDAGSGDISYLKEQAWKVTFANAPAKKKAFSNIIKTSGQILAAPGDETMLSTQISGIVSYAGRSYAAGSALGAGTLLFTVTNNELEKSNINTALQQAEQDLATAKAQFERSSELVKEQVISQKAFLEVKLRYENAEATVNNLSVNKNFNQKKQSIIVPISGFLKNILVRLECPWQQYLKIKN